MTNSLRIIKTVIAVIFQEDLDSLAGTSDSDKASFRLKRTFPCLSISRTLTMTCSPSDSSSETELTRWCASWEICTRPSTFGRISTKAPKSTIFLTVPRYNFPISTSKIQAIYSHLVQTSRRSPGRFEVQIWTRGLFAIQIWVRGLFFWL